MTTLDAMRHTPRHRLRAEWRGIVAVAWCSAAVIVCGLSLAFAGSLSIVSRPWLVLGVMIGTSVAAALIVGLLTLPLAFLLPRVAAAAPAAAPRAAGFCGAILSLILALHWLPPLLGYSPAVPLIVVATLLGFLIARWAALRRNHGSKLPLASNLLAFATLLAAHFGAPRAVPPHEPPRAIRPVGMPPATAPARYVTPRHVVMIVIDTLRADHLSLYGYGRPTSPRLDAWAKQAVVFENCAAQYTLTSPSVATILSGTYPHTHRLAACRTILPDNVVTIGEMFLRAGWHTASFVANPNVGKAFHFDQGFESVDEIYLPDGRSDALRMTDRVLPWLDAHRSDQFFLYVQFLDPHSPYAPSDEFRDLFRGTSNGRPLAPSRVALGDNPVGTIPHSAAIDEKSTDLNHYVQRYDEEIRVADAGFGRILDRLQALGIADETLLVVTSDHGESLFEHEVYCNHGLLAYQNNAAVPLLLGYGTMLGAGRRIAEPVELVDLAATVHDLCAVERSPANEGESLAPLLWGVGARRRKATFTEAGISAGRAVDAVRIGRFKLIRNHKGLDLDSELLRPRTVLSPGRWRRLLLGASGRQLFHLREEFYDLESDPQETRNLAHSDHPEQAALAATLASWIASAPRERITATPAEELDPKALEVLRSLGYVR